MVQDHPFAELDCQAVELEEIGHCARRFWRPGAGAAGGVILRVMPVMPVVPVMPFMFMVLDRIFGMASVFRLKPNSGPLPEITMRSGSPYANTMPGPLLVSSAWIEAFCA